MYSQNYDSPIMTTDFENTTFKLSYETFASIFKMFGAYQEKGLGIVMFSRNIFPRFSRFWPILPIFESYYLDNQEG